MREEQTMCSVLAVSVSRRKNAFGEWVVRATLDGEQVATYYTPERDDALETAEAMRRGWKQNLGVPQRRRV